MKKETTTVDILDILRNISQETLNTIKTEWGKFRGNRQTVEKARENIGYANTTQRHIKTALDNERFRHLVQSKPA